ncbi:MAG: hypothetical protein GY946_16220, partial [bacterium]|nr:hypothetical protein [bacterium]
QTLAIAYVRIEDFSSAADALRQAKRLCSGYPEAWLKIRWVEGLIHQGQSDIARAETCLVEAHQGLSELDQIEDAAVVALDRAILCAEQGRSAEVVPLAAEVAAVFEASRVERERLAALRVLGAEVAEGAVNLAVLREAREELQSLASCDTGGSGDVPDPPVLASQLNWSKQC